MSRSPKQLGRLGEIALRKLAATGDITVNPSEQDEKGWDFILEFTLTDDEVGARRPLDEDDREFKGLAQVKAGETASGYIDVKLSNWRSLVTGTSSPAYFLIFEFNGQDDPQRAYLVHIGRELIAKLLKRLRKEESAGTDELQKKTMRLRYGEENALDPITGPALRQALVESVEGAPRDYATWKNKFISDVGYEGIKGHLTIKPPPDDYGGSTADYIADFAVGLQPHLEIERAEIRNVRFGIISPVPEEIQGGYFKQRTPPKAATLRLSVPDRMFQRMKLDGDLYAPQGIADALPEKHKKYRFSIPHADLLIQHGGADQLTLTLTLSLKGDDSYLLSNLRKGAKLMKYFSEMALDEETVKISLRVDGKEVRLGYCRPREFYEGIEHTDEDLREDVEIAQTVQDAITLVQSLDLDPSSVEARPNRLYRQRAAMRFIARTLQGRSAYALLRYEADGPQDETEEVVSPVPMIIHVGAWRLIFIVALRGTPKPVDEDDFSGYGLPSSEPRIPVKWAAHPDDDISTLIPDLIREAAHRLEEDAHRILMLQDPV